MPARRDEFPGAEQFLPPRITLASMRRAVQGCKGCPLYKPATQAVFGAGPRDARLVIVGEEPGNDEDLAGVPFVGPAGRLLDTALVEAGVNRGETYVTNVVKHFKFEREGKRRIHKRPSAAETRACRPWLDHEIGVIKPRLIVALGATAARALLGNAFRVTVQRGLTMERENGPPVIATIHPASILRERTSEARAAARKSFVTDLRKVAKALR